jgi:hypothetical protein
MRSHSRCMRVVVASSVVVLAACAHGEARAGGSDGAGGSMVASAPSRRPAPPRSGEAASASRGGAARAKVAAPEPVRYCQRRNASCWSCITLDLETSRPCDIGCGANLCVAKAGVGEACVPGESVCCPAGTACDRVPVAGGKCRPACSDPEGSGTLTRCLVPPSCPEQARLDDPHERQSVALPVSWYETLCSPLPDWVQESIRATPPGAGCASRMMVWAIPGEVMASGAGDRTGPGLCYGMVTPGTINESCTKSHCETLLHCGEMREERRCSVVSSCVGGEARVTGMAW